METNYIQPITRAILILIFMVFIREVNFKTSSSFPVEISIFLTKSLNFSFQILVRMTSKVLESCENRQGSKLAMYCERLSERPRLLKHALISTASDIPDNQFKSRKVTAVRKSLCFRSTIDEKVV